MKLKKISNSEIISVLTILALFARLQLNAKLTPEDWRSALVLAYFYISKSKLLRHLI